jgi:multiple sugar transport system ATP-binding protein
VTTIYVTHDQVEAMTMGDRVAVMRRGELQQVASPQQLYDGPVNLFVGGFIGSPAMNLLEATIERANGTLAVSLGSQKVALDDVSMANRPGLRKYEGRDVIVGIRPEHLEDASLATDTPSDRRLKAEVALTEALGAELIVHVLADAKPAYTEDVKELARDAGAPDMVPGTALGEDNRASIIGRFSARSQVRPGQTAEIAVDTSALHFFDPQTGQGIYEGTEERT